MQRLTKCLQQLTLQVKSPISDALTSNFLRQSLGIEKNYIHTSCTKLLWEDYNNKIFPIQKPGEERRPAYVCHSIKNVKYSPKNMWYVAIFVRGMAIDEAIKQLTFKQTKFNKGAAIARDVLLEAQKKAVEEHNVEFKSNLWVAESHCTKGKVIKGLRRHAKGRAGHISYRYVNYYVRLEEGKPPKHYYLPYPKTGEEKLEDWVESMRKRKIANSL